MLIPLSSDGHPPDFGALFDSLLLHDQLDDWVPDPIFYMDLQASRDDTLRRVAALWHGGDLAAVDRRSVLVPRDGGRSLAILNLGFATRILTHAVIAGFAPKIRRALLRDKVGGFDYFANRVPVFSQPGEGAAEITRLARRAVLTGDSGDIEIIDIADFSRSSRPEELERQLKIAGARADQTGFLHHVVETDDGGLPPVDDALAFVYNYYLASVDKRLAASRSNFFRFRDEYFVVTRKAREAVESALREAMVPYRVLKSVAVADTRQQLRERWYEQPVNRRGERPNDELSEAIFQIGEGYLSADYTCDTTAEGIAPDDKPICQTDSFELRYVSGPEATQADFFADCAKGAILDGVKAVPVLRDMNRARIDTVLSPAPLTAAPDRMRSLLLRLRGTKPCLHSALGAAIADRQAWQVAWIAPLLADAGPLDAEETALMRKALDSGLGAVADWPVRTALARATRLPPDEVLRGSAQPGGSFERRSAAVTAYFLARRGATRPWDEMREGTKIHEPSLVRLLDGSLQ